MRKTALLFVIFLAFPFCRKEVVPVLSESYDKEGIRFSYPKGWQVSSDETFQEGKTKTRLINLDMMSGEAMFQVIVLYSETDEAFFLSTVDSMRGRKKEFFVKNNSGTEVQEEGLVALNDNLPKGVTLGVREKYTVQARGETFSYLNRFYFSQSPGLSLFFTTQTAAEKDNQDEPIFRAILESFQASSKR
ncbi:hypothetical protein EHO60_06775 [Leptospira fletcheri]|uniref:Uncharacterized protein n=1 Tax=Leptospira fletcheri TaxID=2484981 RepID=A0A4R9GH07_9LEPT|nr:hypothetical protein [Leptospira fletcheri]TGK11978.1 hypothetical protein EHO60_06775 [Leptospira fletcheri]